MIKKIWEDIFPRMPRPPGCGPACTLSFVLLYTAETRLIDGCYAVKVYNYSILAVTFWAMRDWLFIRHNRCPQRSNNRGLGLRWLQTKTVLGWGLLSLGDIWWLNILSFLISSNSLWVAFLKCPYKLCSWMALVSRLIYCKLEEYSS